jgi:hypothetical protein
MLLSATLATRPAKDTYEWAKTDTHHWTKAPQRTYEWAKTDTHHWTKAA